MTLLIVVAVIAVLIAIGALVAVVMILNKAKNMSLQMQQLSTSLLELQSAPPQTAAANTPTDTRKQTGKTLITIKKTGSSTPKRDTTPTPPPFMQPPIVPLAEDKQTEPALKPIVPPAPPPQEELFINFDCVYCGQNIEAPPVLAHKEITCPTCQKKIRVPPPEQSKKPLPQAGWGEPPPVTEDPNDPARKDATIRLNLGDLNNRPEPTPRSITIKRRDIKFRKL